jgi:hypothetical protein
MVERAEREPTMEEIVGALRETRRGAQRVPPFTVVDSRASGGGADDAAAAGPTGIADLRDGEIQRLLAENAYLNERIIALLKAVERAQSPGVQPVPGDATGAIDRAAIVSGVRAAVAAELRPVLLVLMRLLETARPGRGTLRPSAAETAPGDSDGIVDLDAQRL